ncbi:MAG: alpha/beta fold hydrolase [Flavobacteriales bacterium]
MQLNYKVSGEGEAVIVLHGFLGSLDNWQSLMKELSVNYKVYLIDLRNHGKSEHDKHHNYWLMENDLSEFMLAQNISSAYIIGHSMGGKTAMFFAVQNPGRVDKLIVVDIGPKYYSQHHQSVLNALNSVDLANVSSRQEVENHLMQQLHDVGVVQWLMKNLKRESGESFAWKFNLEGLTREVENIGEALPENAEFTNPTLFIRGGRSNYILDEDIELITQIFPVARLATIPKAGHWVHAEQPEEFSAVIHSFLKNH